MSHHIFKTKTECKNVESKHLIADAPTFFLFFYFLKLKMSVQMLELKKKHWIVTKKSIFKAANKQFS